MNVIVDLAPSLAIALLLVIALLGLSLLLIARPWRSAGSGLTDRWRIGAAVFRYDAWLELRGVNRRRRRDLREELRANLDAAAEQVGTTSALAALGSLREMSAEAVAPDAGPRWSTGAMAAAGAFTVVTVVELIAVIAWNGAAEASGVAQVQGQLPLFPGSLASWERVDGGLSIGLEPGWLVFAAIAIAFVLGSRPWLAVSRHRGGRNQAGSTPIQGR